MKKNDAQIVRDALDRRLAALGPSAARRARIRERIAEEEPAMKKKLTASLAAALIAALLLAGAALAVGLNLFDVFGKNDERLSQLADEAALPTVDAQSVESEALGASEAAIENAYYDGRSLIVAYRLKNGARVEEFVPTQAELAQAEALEGPVHIAVGREADRAIVERFHQAQEDGEPFGIVQYALHPSDHTLTDDGIDLPPSGERTLQGEDGALLSLREYEFPLPEAAQERETLNISIRLIESASYLYFDGDTCYSLPGTRREAGELTASVRRTPGGTRRYVGEGEWAGTPLKIEAQFSRAYGRITLTVDGAPSALGADARLEACDETNVPMRCLGMDPQTDGVTYLFNGTGALPERIAVRLILSEEEGQSVPIELSIVE